MFLRLPVVLLLALCAASCARERRNAKLVSRNAHSRTTAPSVSGEFCDCFNGRSGEEVSKHINLFINASKSAVPTNSLRKNTSNIPLCSRRHFNIQILYRCYTDVIQILLTPPVYSSIASIILPLCP